MIDLYTEGGFGALWGISSSLKKTCRKLGVSFHGFLLDRLTQAGSIPSWPELMRTIAVAGKS